MPELNGCGITLGPPLTTIERKVNYCGSMATDPKNLHASGWSRRKTETIDWSKCPLVEIDPKIQSGAPVLRGTRMPVSAIVDNFDYGVSAKEIAEQFETPLERVEAVLAYVKSQRLAHSVG